MTGGTQALSSRRKCVSFEPVSPFIAVTVLLQIKRIIIHDRYQGFISRFFGDIALIELETKLPQHYLISSICVDEKNSEEVEPEGEGTVMYLKSI